jgi:phenylacetic acid degradation operon negative regulatory protein
VNAEPAATAGGDRAENGASARRPPRLLLTLLGDYWWRRKEPLPSAGLVALLAEFGISGAAARTALSRLVRNGLLVTSKQGRRTFHRLSDRAAAVLDDGAQRIFSFGLSTQDWDGRWSVVAFSVPEHSRASRHRLREQLRWLGFAPLYDGVWVSPRDRTAEATRRLAELGIHTATVFRATTVPGVPDGGLPQRAWDLDVSRVAYDSFVAATRSLHRRAVTGTLSPSEALVARTEVMNQWRGFPRLDPELPVELLPEGWPRTRARELFVSTYDVLGPLAEHRVREVLARYSPELAPSATHHNSDPTVT